MNTKPYSHAVVLYTTSVDAYFATALVRRILHQKYLLPDSCIDARSYSFIDAGRLNNTYVPKDSVLFLVGVRISVRESDRILSLARKVGFENTLWFDNSNDSVYNPHKVVKQIPGARETGSLASSIFNYFKDDEDMQWDECENLMNIMELHEEYTNPVCTKRKALSFRYGIMIRNYDSIFGYDKPNVWDRAISDSAVANEILQDGYRIDKYVDLEELDSRKHAMKFARIGILGTDGVKQLDAAIMNRVTGGIHAFDGMYKKCDICIKYYHNGSKYMYELFSKDASAGCNIIAKSMGGHGGTATIGVNQYGTFVREDNIMAKVRPLFRINGPIKDLWPDIPLKEIDGDLPDSEITRELGRRDANEKRLATVGAPDSDDDE